MRKFFLLLALAACTEAREQDVVAIAKQRNVAVYTEDNHGSGVLLECNGKRGTVLTVFHVLRIGEPIMVNGIKAKVLKTDHERDLLLLTVPCDFELPSVPYGEVQQGDHILYVGNILGVYGTLIFGRVARMDKDTLVVDATTMPGASGSGVWNDNGQLVAVMNQAVEGDKGGHLGLAVYGVNDFK